MGMLNGKPPGRPPNYIDKSRRAEPEPGDERGAYAYEQLLVMDAKFRTAMERAIARGLERPPGCERERAA